MYSAFIGGSVFAFSAKSSSLNVSRTSKNFPQPFLGRQALVRRLETELKAAGAEVWVDHAGVRGGDNLPKEISAAFTSNRALKLRLQKLA